MAAKAFLTKVSSQKSTRHETHIDHISHRGCSDRLIVSARQLANSRANNAGPGYSDD
jgi:hypothetical protein